MIKRLNKKWIIFFLMLPTMGYLIFMVIYPLIFSVMISFTRFTPSGGTLSLFAMPFAGLKNYARVFRDHVFAISMSNTFKILLIALVVEMILGLGIALLLSKKFVKIRGLFMVLILSPMMLPMVASGLIWRMLFHLEYGMVNALLKFIHLSPIDWLGSANNSLLTIIAVDIWQWTPFVILVLLAGLQAIPEEQYESAYVDGAGTWTTFAHITIPLLKYPLMVVLLIRTMDIFKVFDSVYTLTHGGPGYSSQTISFYTYLTGFRKFDLGYASAISWFIFIIVYFITFLFIKAFKIGDLSQ